MVIDETNIKETANYLVEKLKQGHRCEKYEKYYEGDQPITMSYEKLREIFKQNIEFIINHCGVVVDSPIDRIKMTGFGCEKDTRAKAALDSLFTDSDIALLQDDVHRWALVYGHSFLVAWPDSEDDTQINAFFHSPKNVAVMYCPENPKKKIAAAKWWNEGKAKMLNIYTPDWIYHYRSEKCDDVKDITAFALLDPVEQNPYGVIPVFEFCRDIKHTSELKDAVKVQDAINKCFNDMMVTAEFCAFPVHWGITNAIMQGVKFDPSTFMQFPPAADGEQKVEVGQFAAASLSGYLEAIRDLEKALSTITRTPAHYFASGGQAPSGESLKVQESPLVNKCNSYIARFSATWQEFAAFCLKTQGIDVKPKEVSLQWEPCETTYIETRATVRKTNKEAGIPIRTQLRDEGWTEEQLTQLEQDAASEAVSTAGITAGPKAPLATQAAARTAAANTIAATSKEKIATAIQQQADKAINKMDNGGLLQAVVDTVKVPA